MIDVISINLVKLKQKFKQSYSGSSHIQEVIPLAKSESFPIDQNDLDALHMFANKKLMELTVWCMMVISTNIG